MKHPGPGWLCFSCCFLVICFCITEIHTFSTTLTQIPVSITELLTKDIEISCFIKGENIDNLRLYWYRKSNKKGDLEFVGSATTSLDKYSYGDNINQNRFIIRRVKFQNLFTLKIMKLNFTDIGDYYCMAELASKVAFGDGTKLSVVETLPTTVKPTSKKPPCKCKKPNVPKTSGADCSYAIWLPLAGCAVILLIGLYLLVSHTCRNKYGSLPYERLKQMRQQYGRRRGFTEYTGKPTSTSQSTRVCNCKKYKYTPYGARHNAPIKA